MKPLDNSPANPAAKIVLIPELEESSKDSAPRVETVLTFADRWGAWKARWGIKRMNFRVNPGLYRVGNPDEHSPVLVSANYKMSFDLLRQGLDGFDAWILVLDTQGINVWCAAGKGTFGTAELVRRMAIVDLNQAVDHRTLILPQLGAPGVAAHKVKQMTGFKVVYGPVRAADIAEFIRNGYTAIPEMRRVRFDLLDRIVLIPMEVVPLLRYLIIAGLGLIFLHYSGLKQVAWSGVYPFLGAVVAGAVITPILLPCIPGRSFAWKGWLLGLMWALAVITGQNHGENDALREVAWLLLLPGISAYLALNFTGASTFTSLSGVKKEMKVAVPLIIISLATGVAAGLLYLSKAAG